MKLSTTFVWFVAAVLAISNGCARSKSEGYATLSVQWERQTVDLGIRAGGQLFQVAYPFRNTGRAPVTLLAGACCGATALVTPAVVAPGGSGVVSVSGTTPLSNNGDVTTKVIRLQAAGHPGYEDELRLLYCVHPTWHLVPPDIDFGAIGEGTVSKRRLRVYLDHGAAGLRGVVGGDIRVTTRLDAVSPGDRYDFIVTFKSPIDVHGPLASSLRMLTQDSTYPTLDIPIRAVVRPCAQIVPLKVLLRQFRMHTPPTPHVAISSPERIDLLDVRCPAWITLHSKRQSLRSFSMVLDVHPSRAGVLAGTVGLHVKTHHSFWMMVPVSGYATL